MTEEEFNVDLMESRAIKGLEALIDEYKRCAGDSPLYGALIVTFYTILDTVKDDIKNKYGDVKNISISGKACAKLIVKALHDVSYAFRIPENL